MATVSIPGRRPTRKEIALYYKTHRSQFFAPEHIHVLHIVKNVEESAEREAAWAAMNAAREELENGVPFAQVADRYSDCAGNGGDLGRFPRGIMVDEFDEVVFDLPAGQVSQIFETRFGLHIALVVEKRAAGILSMKDVYDEIAERIYADRLKKASLR